MIYFNKFIQILLKINFFLNNIPIAFLMEKIVTQAIVAGHGSWKVSLYQTTTQMCFLVNQFLLLKRTQNKFQTDIRKRKLFVTHIHLNNVVERLNFVKISNWLYQVASSYIDYFYLVSPNTFFKFNS